ncbi:MAG: Smr/MutS family protein [Tissierellia bacterium]|nr:Smr/MutS family protein [Tissierellia bacterium]
MKKIFEDIFTKNLPTLDLHGYDRYTAGVAVNDFILENSKLKYHEVVIIHGIGIGIIKKTVHDNLKSNRLVTEYKLHNFNIGMTIVKIK